ncbi:triose-phosphate transporter family-domain-containing protein [Lipomyces arxii]|uniref:triose-phosphate transporter family-domain-containing protein n=1 Tax=Lipomyces arxii TaxID=56418 RepID=UPI0034CF85F1
MVARRNSIVESTAHGFQQLAPPISLKLIFLSLSWYWTSAVSNTLTKSILNAFPYPITLTLLQFAFVVMWALAISFLARSNVIGLSHTGITRPTKQIILTIAPMAVFQLSGHIFSHIATSKIPVTLVHTIKGLSPLFTVLAYRFVFGVHYSMSTYISLVPLTIGVMLACSFDFHGQLLGLMSALFAAIIFVSQNIFSKNLLTNTPAPDSEPKKKLDKINLLCYCSGMAFIFTSPIWFYYEGAGLLREYLTTGTVPILAADIGTAMPLSTLISLFILNGSVHFGQNFLAFQILGLVSPVTYSIASLFKRVFVIIVAIIWFGQELTALQNWGIALTFLGLYMYDRAAAFRILPIHASDVKDLSDSYVTSTASSANPSARNSYEAYRHSDTSPRDEMSEKYLLHPSHVSNSSSTILVA